MKWGVGSVAQFIPRDQVQWRQVGYLQRPNGSWEYRLVLPEPLASWDVYGVWERERVHSMREHLKPGMTLFDVGAEHGWCSLVYASMVGPENMVLIEPEPSFWPNIEATWHKNFSADPRACYWGLVSDKTTDNTDTFAPWPTQTDGPLIDRNAYQYIHQHTEGLGEMRLDDLVARSGIAPDAITIDVEGAELLVLQGAAETLRQHHPLCWVSVHPDLGERDYGVVPADVHDFMNAAGYMGAFLGRDHEEHWFFQPHSV